MQIWLFSSIIPGAMGSRGLRAVGILALSVLLILAAGCRRGSKDSGDLLHGKAPLHAKGVTSAERINDGEVPPQGSAWNSNRTAVFSARGSSVDFDLGSEKAIGALALMGDNNDTYLVLGSSDGKSYRTLWTAGRESSSGLRWRSVSGLDHKARYLRFQAGNGDSALSISEAVAYTEAPAVFPPRLREVAAVDSALEFRNALLVFSAVAVILVLLSATTAPLLWNLGLAGLALWSGYRLMLAFSAGFPLDQVEVSLTRAACATIAAAVVLREAFGPQKLKPVPAISIGVLSLTAFCSVATFFNLGHPQFYDHKNREPGLVHNYDMRVYFPVAKYFKELKYDGLYLASVATYAEEHGGLDTPEMKRTELRDLRDHRMRKVPAIREEIEAIRHRFSDERWAELKEDMRYFWETMGNSAYLSSMSDHGGNATPVWLTLAYWMFRTAPASNEVLTWAGLLDPLLLLAFAIGTWRAFGIRTALVSLVIFGANDFYMFGSNWAGATLRNDWMVYLGLGACALKLERYRLGGALLAMSALIRAFPAISLLVLALPVIYFGLEKSKSLGRIVTLKELIEGNRWFVEVAIGASMCVAIAVSISSGVLGLDAWPLWVKKISSFTASPHVNHISLITMTAGSEGNQAIVLRERWPLHTLLVVAFFGLAAWAAYRRPPHVVALLGILLMPIFMYPANYYIHFVFLLALLVTEPLLSSDPMERAANGKVWLALLLLCAALFITVREKDLALHFYNASVMLIGALLYVLVQLLPREADGSVQFPPWLLAAFSAPEVAPLATAPLAAESSESPAEPEQPERAEFAADEPLQAPLQDAPPGES